MARIAKYAVGIVISAAVVAGAVYVAREVDVLAGSLVVLAALIALSLGLRLRAARDERSGMADWEDVLETNAPDDAFFSEWTMSDGERPAHAATDELVVEAHTAAGLESLEELLADTDEFTGDDAAAEADPEPAPVDTTPPAPEPTTVVTSPSNDDRFPFDDPSDTWGDLPPLPGLDPTPTPTTDDPSADHSPAEPPTPAGDDADEEPAGHRPAATAPLPGPSPVEAPTPVAPAAADPASDPEVPVVAAADTYSLAGVGQPSGNGAAPRRSIIDWSGPVHAIDEQVRTSDDILAASAATALPTSEDRPAPTGGSELTRLLSKVEARLRDYE